MEILIGMAIVYFGFNILSILFLTKKVVSEHKVLEESFGKGFAFKHVVYWFLGLLFGALILAFATFVVSLKE